MQLNTSNQAGLNARAAWSTYFFFGLISLPFLLPVFAILHKYRGKIVFAAPSDMLVVVFFPVACLFAVIWIASFQITVSGSELSYKTLFGGKRTLTLAQISSAETELGAGKLFGPFYRLVIVPKGRGKPLVINMKIFEKRDLQRLLVILGDKAVDAPRFSVISNSE